MQCIGKFSFQFHHEKKLGTSMGGFFVLLILYSLLSIPKISNAVDTITATRFMGDGDTIVSSGGSFELGFFTPGNTTNRYVGIWYKNIAVKTVVWVANRGQPLTNMSGVLKVIQPGILVLLINGTNSIIWSSINTSRKSLQTPVAQLLDSGNLVVRDANDDHNEEENFMWQSFDYPSDTLLPGMKLGLHFETGVERHLSSWKSSDDPAPGDFTFRCDPSGYPQNFLKKGTEERYRSGPWNGLRFSGSPNLRPDAVYTFRLVFNKKEVFYSYELANKSVLSRFVLNQDGVAQRFTWVHRIQDWSEYLKVPAEICDTYAKCGAYGSCNIGSSPVCRCLDKFVAKNPEAWARADWSDGCVRETLLDCNNNSRDGFLKYSNVKLPDTRHSWFDERMTLKECQRQCLKNCSCMAYATLDIRQGGSGCLVWLDELIDIKEVSEGGQDIYVRVASSDSKLVHQSGFSRKKRIITIVTSSVVAGMVLLGLSLTLYVRKKSKKTLHLNREGNQGHNSSQDYTIEWQNEDVELPLFGLSTIVNATSGFSIDNKLGQGGYGPVYKGVLEEGQEIAVKRLSKTSLQGLNEFKNEVICISKLQHRNLVKLLGCCIQGDEKMLIFEYMPNKSLDSFIFDETQSKLLDWSKRFDIINGIARGLMYLHQDSRLRIVHGDLKASNILLDFDMNPKISDFGIARSFGGNETGANTNKVVGTYGYISPEYAVDGIFSVKSDVFSFGVLVLEIVSGKRNRGFIHGDHRHNLLGHAWSLHKEGRSMELNDTILHDSCCLSDVLRTIQVGLLCVQQYPEDRPSMSSVVLMLGSESGLPTPNQPGFFTERRLSGKAECSSSTNATQSNEISVTLLDGR